ncbi:hypothetical protein SAMN04487948_103199 [Halogranum amylolyticum]|uniref:Uncharacterized protein n=1 Tax=Halogranum amylolyticum TaxID=660520 RepID=A0A1H8QMZ9_9EURY|nr:hypothetical protein [Halogranum amylolyticum]SEO55337.1 hypothetical protein SAMN04487948_103199 [Halogranum amylolyticum]
MIRPPHSPTTRSERRTFLRALAGLTALGGAASVFAGTATAHFPADLDVSVAPFRGDGPLPRHDRGQVRVAVTNVDDVVATADATRYRFGAPDVVADGGGAEATRACRIRDVDDDGRNDLVLRFPFADAGFSGEEERAELRWDRDESREHGLSGVDDVSFRCRRER